MAKTVKTMRFRVNRFFLDLGLVLVFSSVIFSGIELYTLPGIVVLSSDPLPAILGSGGLTIGLVVGLSGALGGAALFLAGDLLTGTTKPSTLLVSGRRRGRLLSINFDVVKP
jgi:hypothetical protein